MWSAHLSSWDNYAPSCFLLRCYNIADLDTVVLFHSFSTRHFLNIRCYMLDNSFLYELTGPSYVISVIGKIRRRVIFRNRFEGRSRREYDGWISRIITVADTGRSYFSESVTKSAKMYCTIFGIKNKTKINFCNLSIIAKISSRPEDSYNSKISA